MESISLLTNRCGRKANKPILNIPLPISLTSTSSHIQKNSSSLAPNTNQYNNLSSQICYWLSCREGQPMLPANCLKQFPAQQPFFGTQSFICNNMRDQAILLYARMVNSSTSNPDPYTYSSTLKACAETRQIHIGKAVHCHILRSHLIYPPSRIVCNSLLSIYYVTCTSSSPSSRCDSLVSRVFDTIRKKQNVVAWNVIISCYVKKERFLQALVHFVMLMKTGLKPTVNGLDDEGLMLVCEMQKQGFVIDSVSVTALLSVASNLRNHGVGK